MAETYAKMSKGKEKGKQQHTGSFLDIEIKPPVFKVPENIFLPLSPYLELNLGSIKIKSTLQDY